MKKLLCEPENWLKVKSKISYQFPGAPVQQQLYFTSDLSSHGQSCDDPHFIWKDNQLSKGQLNKDHLIEIIRSSPCTSVKLCPISDCSHLVPIRDKRNCPTHNTMLMKTTSCPLDFVYLYPKDASDGRRWFGGLVRCHR